MNVKIGELNKKITFIWNSPGLDDEGFPIKGEGVPQTLTCWAKVSNKSGSEIFKAGADYNKTITRFLVRYNKAINENMKIEFDNKTFKIVYLNNYNYKNEWLEIICEVIE